MTPFLRKIQQGNTVQQTIQLNEFLDAQYRSTNLLLCKKVKLESLLNNEYIH